MSNPTPHFFNTLTRTVEPFAPIEPMRVKMYTCGPTVYNFAHIGNFRAYVFEDLLDRYLAFRGYHVHRIMNLTDVDDKTIRGSRAQGIPLEQFTQPFKDAFFSDLDTLRIKRAAAFPAATDYIPQMIEIIKTLIERNHAYRAEDGSVYFRIASFPQYGCLAHLNLDELKPGARVSSDEYEKENVGDFALWKAHTIEDGDIAWDSPWGRGRPGWHIECSAMSRALLGDQIDIHCGGEDNIFPHHEAEIAQTESATGKSPFVRFWMHCRHLLVAGKKMAKSEGNFFTLRDLIERGWSGREIRFVLISVKYREPLNFTFESLDAARTALARYDEWSRLIAEKVAPAAVPEALPADINTAAFGLALDDDLNISAALGALFDTIRTSNRLLAEDKLSPGQLRSLADWRTQIETVLALEAAPEQIAIPTEIQTLLDARTAARAAKDWAQSDTLRDQIEKAGWIIKDSKDGQLLRRAGAAARAENSQPDSR